MTNLFPIQLLFVFFYKFIYTNKGNKNMYLYKNCCIFNIISLTAIILIPVYKYFENNISYDRFHFRVTKIKIISTPLHGVKLQTKFNAKQYYYCLIFRVHFILLHYFSTCELLTSMLCMRMPPGEFSLKTGRVACACLDTRPEKRRGEAPAARQM